MPATALPDLAANAVVAAVGGAGTFLDAFDTLHGILNGGSTDCTLDTVVGAAGSYEFVDVIMPSASLPNMRIAIAGKAAGAPIMQTPDTFLANAFHVGLAKGLSDVPAYTNPWGVGALNPYNTAQFLGFARGSAAVTFAEVLVFETAETLHVYFRTPANAFYGFMAGPLWDPEFVNAGETHSRVYGIITNGSTATMSTAFGSSANNFLDHGAANGNCHSYILEPGAATAVVVERESTMKANWTPADTEANDHYPTLYHRRYLTTYDKVGRLREVFMAKGYWRRTSDVGGTPVYYLMGGSNTTDVDAIAIKI